MPVISKGNLVLVTGASGFVGSHVSQHFLKGGFKVRGTVRSESKGEYLKKLFKNDGDFDYVIVDDIAKDGAFDEAVKGVDAVAHTASPFYVTNIKSTDELIQPALHGTTGILKSIQKNNPDVKRVVVTSSVSAIMCVASKKAPYTYTEKDWNVDSVGIVEEKGVDAPGLHIYNASKTLAERSLWDFVEKNKPNWEAVTINPPVIFGEIIHECPTPEKLNTSVARVYEWAAGKKTEKDLPAAGGNWVDVHNVAEGHVLALTKPDAAGERFIVGNGPFAGQDICDVIHKRFPDLKDVPVGKPGTHDEITKDANVFDGSKAHKELGIQYVSLEDSVYQTVKSVRERFHF
ncbi:D-lactaldehyde dehydrogenase [Kockovaella imperatae]|uniref:D-lactaldehyde dehydrogenase n=1 Tax=Kockovaella imperatae TaxID=4999 RepID=A0A1Y1UM56_9TREE|nr:D-lactaldehyde dehydrogenase [Kockovaella imperatae]ORX38574.1 D-lactaldehyde dehydrogenase [Kockovaella imperatae]